MGYQVKTFQELTLDELHAIYKVRVEVFVVEQACPYQEVDDADKESLHIFEVREGKVVAYCRLIPHHDVVHLGRVLVAKGCRKKQLGSELVQFALEVSHQRFGKKPIYAQAQAYLQKFYESFGFAVTSDVYLEDDIPHIDMIREV